MRVIMRVHVRAHMCVHMSTCMHVQLTKQIGQAGRKLRLKADEVVPRLDLARMDTNLSPIFLATIMD